MSKEATVHGMVELRNSIIGKLKDVNVTAKDARKIIDLTFETIQELVETKDLTVYKFGKFGIKKRPASGLTNNSTGGFVTYTYFKPSKTMKTRLARTERAKALKAAGTTA